MSVPSQVGIRERRLWGLVRVSGHRRRVPIEEVERRQVLLQRVGERAEQIQRGRPHGEHRGIQREVRADQADLQIRVSEGVQLREFVRGESRVPHARVQRHQVVPILLGGHHGGVEVGVGRRFVRVRTQQRDRLAHLVELLEPEVVDRERLRMHEPHLAGELSPLVPLEGVQDGDPEPALSVDRLRERRLGRRGQRRDRAERRLGHGGEPGVRRVRPDVRIHRRERARQVLQDLLRLLLTRVAEVGDGEEGQPEPRAAREDRRIPGTGGEVLGRAGEALGPAARLRDRRPSTPSPRT